MTRYSLLEILLDYHPLHKGKESLDKILQNGPNLQSLNLWMFPSFDMLLAVNKGADTLFQSKSN